MIVIEKVDQFINFLDSYSKEEKAIILPIFIDHKRHPLDNQLSLLYVRFFSGNRFMLVFDHSEGLFLDSKCIDTFREYKTKIFTFDKKILSHVFKFSDNIMDMHILSYLAGKDLPELDYETNTHRYIYKHLRTRSNLNRIIPLVKHFEMCDKTADDIAEVHALNFQNIKVNRRTYSFYNDTIIPVFTKIEQSGLKIHDKYLWSEYNLYTATGRPSNRFGGINFAALNKTDGTRKKFISRFAKGALLQFDYMAYHLRLIGDIINYDLPSESMHTYLGRQYFDKKDDLTEEEYSESKKISFKFLYGETPADIAEAIPFFGKVKKYVDELWNEINTLGYIESPISSRRIYKNKIRNINSTKLFNYQIQLLETEKNCLTLVKIQEFLEEYESRLILYTYDSFLFDINMNDGKDFFKTLQSVIECAGRFPTKTYLGKNYDELKVVVF